MGGKQQVEKHKKGTLRKADWINGVMKYVHQYVMYSGMATF